MVRAEVLQGVRQMRFEGLLERHERGELSQQEAAEMLGVSERTFRRWRDRLRDEGPEGLRDRRIGKPSSRRAAVEEILRMLGLYQERYEGFTVKHFHEQLRKRHNYKLGYTVTRLALQGAGLVRPAPRRSAHRKKRPRRPMVGMMLHQSLPSRKRGTPRGLPGCRAMTGNTIWWLPSMTRPARSTRASWSRRKARLRAFARWPR
jgi:transposase